MRILLLNLYYPPDTSATARMAQTVVEALSVKHEVTVVCGRPSYDPLERRAWRLWRTEWPENPEGKRVKIVRVGSADYPRTEMRRRVLNYLTYVALGVPRALFVPCDVVLAMTDPPFEGIVGAFVALLKSKPYVYNIRDLYPDMAVGGSIIHPGLLARVWEMLHRWSLRRAARVIVLGNDMRARIISKGISPERVAVVRDGADIPERSAPGTEIDAEVVRAIRADFKFVLLHAGNLGFYGAWETLVGAARELAAEGIGVVFVGDGAQRAQIEAAAADCTNVRFLPFFPADKIPSVLAAADAHVVTIKRGLEGVIVPSKMYGILAAGKPILAIAPPETDVASIGSRRGFAVSADPDDASHVVRAVRQIFRNAETLRTMGEAARAAASDYDRLNELRKFTQIIEQARPA